MEHKTLLSNLKGYLSLFEAASRALDDLILYPEQKRPAIYELAYNSFYNKVAGDTFFTAFVIQNSAMEFFRAETALYSVPEGNVDDDSYLRRCQALHGLYAVLIRITSKTIEAIEGEMLKEKQHERFF